MFQQQNKSNINDISVRVKDQSVQQRHILKKIEEHNLKLNATESIQYHYHFN